MRPSGVVEGSRNHRREEPEPQPRVEDMLRLAARAGARGVRVTAHGRPTTTSPRLSARKRAYHAVELLVEGGAMQWRPASTIGGPNRAPPGTREAAITEGGRELLASLDTKGAKTTFFEALAKTEGGIDLAAKWVDSMAKLIRLLSG